MTILSMVFTALFGVLLGWLLPRWAPGQRQASMSSSAPPEPSPEQPAIAQTILGTLKDLGHDAWWVYDLQGQVVEHNRCAREMFGLSPEQAFPQLSELQIRMADSKAPVTDLATLVRRSVPYHDDHWLEIQEFRKPIRLTVQNLSHHGGEGWLFLAQDRTAELTREITSSVVSQQDLQTINAALSVRTEELLLDLHKRNLELEAANRDLQSFAHSVAHDLRTPLRGLDGFSQALAEDYKEVLDDTAQGYLSRIRKASQRLGDLLDDLLDYSRVTRATMQVSLIDFSKMASKVAAGVVRSGTQHIDIQIESHMQVYGDLMLLRTMMQHLITNSVKFSAQRSHTSIQIGSETLNGETTYFVRDNGVGFDMKYAGQMFQPFHRLHGHQEFEGNGMGLAVVKRIVERHGGRIWAEGALNEGATIHFTLPVPKEKA